MGSDRIVELQIEGLRTLADVRLELGPLTVLIGENSTGKSSILEACAILARVAREDFYAAFHQKHEGLPALLRRGANRLRLAVRVSGGGGEGADADERDLFYELVLGRQGVHTTIDRERLILLDNSGPGEVLGRRQNAGTWIGSLKGDVYPLNDVSLPRDRLLLTSFGSNAPNIAVTRMIKALQSIEVHAPVDVLPAWVGNELQWETPLRASVRLFTSERQSLSLKGTNLANLFHALRNEYPSEHWRDTMSYVRLGLGEDILDVKLPGDPGGGAIALAIEYRDLGIVPARYLSDGTLTWLAFVALARIGKADGLLAFDEPESHLHPGLLRRMVGLFESISRERTVVLATHSDTLLDALENPAQSVVVCALDDKRRTRLLRPDSESLERWLTRYRGLGEIRAAGHEESIFPKPAKDVPSLLARRRSAK